MATRNVEILGLDKLKRALAGMPEATRAPILRSIARRPASKAASVARQLFPYGDTGVTVRTIGTLKTRDPRQTFVEVGFKGRSLGYIYISKEVITREGRGSVKGTPWLFDRAGQVIRNAAKTEMKIDISRVMARYLKRYGYTMR